MTFVVHRVQKMENVRPQQEEVRLTLTVQDRFEKAAGVQTTFLGDERSVGRRTVSSLPMTVEEKAQGEGWFARLRNSGERKRPGSTSSEEEEGKRREKEKEAEEFISSLVHRSLTIQYAMLEKTLSKEKRRIKFGLSSAKFMDLAIRRYTYKSLLHV
jgi:hypothetical protein